MKWPRDALLPAQVLSHSHCTVHSIDSQVNMLAPTPLSPSQVSDLAKMNMSLLSLTSERNDANRFLLQFRLEVHDDLDLSLKEQRLHPVLWLCCAKLAEHQGYLCSSCCSSQSRLGMRQEFGRRQTGKLTMTDPRDIPYYMTL